MITTRIFKYNKNSKFTFDHWKSSCYTPYRSSKKGWPNEYTHGNCDIFPRRAFYDESTEISTNLHLPRHDKKQPKIVYNLCIGKVYFFIKAVNKLSTSKSKNLYYFKNLGNQSRISSFQKSTNSYYVNISKMLTNSVWYL